MGVRSKTYITGKNPIRKWLKNCPKVRTLEPLQVPKPFVDPLVFPQCFPSEALVAKRPDDSWKARNDREGHGKTQIQIRLKPSHLGVGFAQWMTKTSKGRKEKQHKATVIVENAHFGNASPKIYCCIVR